MLDLSIFGDKYSRFLEDSSMLFKHGGEFKLLGFAIIIFLIYLTYSFSKILHLRSLEFKNSNNINKKDVFIFASVNIFLLLMLVVFFPINVPFVDDWIYLNNAYETKYLLPYFFASEGNHSFFLYKILGYLDFSFLHFSQQFFNLFAVLVLGSTALVFLKSDFLEEKTNIVKFIFIAILFSPKQIINITQSVNLVWLFFLFFTSLFVCSGRSDKLSATHALSIIFSVFSIGSGLCVAMYAFFTNIFKREIKNYFYVFFSVISIFTILYIFPKFSDFSAINSSSFIEEFSTHFSLINLLGLPIIIANIFAPPHFYFFPLPMLIGAFQLAFLIKVEFRNFMTFTDLNKFILRNPLIIIGLMSAVLLILFRKFPDYLAARYSTISIIFQLGFLVWFFENRGFMFLKKILIYVFLICYSLSWFIPYEGFFHHLTKYRRSLNVESCYKDAVVLNGNIESCNDYAYSIVFNGGSWFDRALFAKSIHFLHDNNLNFFNNISGTAQNFVIEKNK